MAFDVITPKRLAIDELPTSTGTLYTVPASTRTMVKQIDIANNNLADVVVSVYMVPSGDTADATNLIVPGITLAASSMFQWSGVQVLNAGDTIQAVAATTNVAIMISGGEAV